jgi:hypothetical protein
MLSTDSDVHRLFTVKLVLAAFNLAAIVNYHKNEEHPTTSELTIYNNNSI